MSHVETHSYTFCLSGHHAALSFGSSEIKSYCIFGLGSVKEAIKISVLAGGQHMFKTTVCKNIIFLSLRSSNNAVLSKKKATVLCDKSLEYHGDFRRYWMIV